MKNVDSRSGYLVNILKVVAFLLCSAVNAMGVTVSWNGPSSVTVGQTFYCYAYVDGVKRASGYVHVSSSSTGSVYSGDADGQWRAAKAGTVIFFLYSMMSDRSDTRVRKAFLLHRISQQHRHRRRYNPYP